MKSREVSGENNNNSTGSEWDSLEEVPFFGEDPYKKKHKENEHIRNDHTKQIEISRADREKVANEIENKRLGFYESDRAQEIIERDINSRIMTVEELYQSEGIEKRTIPYGDGEVEVYDLEGAPYRLLVTALDFKKDAKGLIGYEMQEKIMKDPSIWSETREQAEKTESFGKELSDSRSDVIFTSYINSEANADTFVDGEVVYGFDHIRPDSVIRATVGDGGTRNNIGKHRTFVNKSEVNFVRGLEKGRTGGYNEISLRRYDESGEPLKPSYLIVKDGKITESVLHHASYWGIPILNIDTSAYREKAREKGKKILDSIDSSIGYIELEKKLSELVELSEYSDYKIRLDEVGRYDKTLRMNGEEKRIKKLELEKALSFLADALENITLKIEEATEKNEIYTGENSDYGIKTLIIDLVDEHGDAFSKLGVSHRYDKVVCRHIDIMFGIKDVSAPDYQLTVHDGERRLDGSQPEEGADSSYYDKLEPIVRRYLEAYWKNQELLKAKEAA